MSDEPLPRSEIILYQTEDGRTRIQCRFEGETLWLTQAIIAERADAAKPFMSLQTTRPGGIVRKDDVTVAKNDLTEDELQVLNWSMPSTGRCWMRSPSGLMPSSSWR